MKTLAILALLVSNLSAGPLQVRLKDFEDPPLGWRLWSHRAATAPRVFVDSTVSHSGRASLAVSGNGNALAHGGWEHDLGPIAPGKWYRLSVSYRWQGVMHPVWQIVARIDWRDSQNKRVAPPDYLYQQRPEGDWMRTWIEAAAPERASVATVQLFLSHAPHGVVWWDDVRFEEIPPPGPRHVRIAAVHFRPQHSPGPQANVEAFIERFQNEVHGPTDIILFPEGMTVVGTGRSYVEVAESVPGPTTERLAKLAKARNSYIVAGLYEAEGTAVYNTAVLLDRQGRLAGKYRKVYLPREEYEAGLTPGNQFPVFDADFGRLGLMICYDVFFSDPAKALAMQGAEMILLPIWGGDEVLARARAIENRVFLVTSGYDHPTYIMDPDGERLSVASGQGRVAVATVDLSKRYSHPHLGDMRARRRKEQRTDVLIPPPSGQR
ncbi:MAG: carbon-nitrogen hydrolase family protein [Bryobacteraceae bacterium]|nr:carbon-nitrogen hydrolase family protein [Bryobacteraceae bacterium]MDW8379322.1 carbon-nitrogen hydrolase family protein [Bryobacterales bacterium]